MAVQKGKKATASRTTRKTPSAKSSGKITSRTKQFGDSIVDEIILILIIAGSVVALISLLSNKMGVVGRLISNLLKGTLGIGGIFVPLLAIAYCVWLLVSEEKKSGTLRLGSAIGFVFCLSVGAGILSPVYFDDSIGAIARAGYYFENGGFLNGGLVGGVFGGGLLRAFDKMGSIFIILVILLICVIVGTGKSFFHGIGNMMQFHQTRKKAHREKIKLQARLIQEQEEREAEMLAKKEAKKGPRGQFNYIIEEGEEDEKPLVEETVFGKARKMLAVKEKKPVFDFQAEEMLAESALITREDEQEEELAENTALSRMKEDIPLEETPPPILLSGQGFLEDEEEETVEIPAPIILSGRGALEEEPLEEPEEVPAIESIDLIEDGVKEVAPVFLSKKPEIPPEKPASVHTLISNEQESPYVFPPLELLGKDTAVQNKGSKVEMLHNAQKLEETLRSFGVEATVTQINKGPTVTRYELSPSKGVKVSKIVNLSDDIALNLAASGIRIEAPIPGKAAVGIEVPNKEPQSVSLRSVMDSDAFQRFPSKLAFALGQDIAGNPVVADIGKMPHLLIAGATGSGKSVCINTLITSILYKADPKEVKLLLVDPKVVELSIYNGIPHLLIPVVTDPKKAAAALNWAVREMLARYNDFAASNVRDISGFNALKRENGEEESCMAQIVIVIDELADLMMAAPGEVEDAICRLAQMARAAGMHLIIATQRPSVDVITGVIKANIPSRLAFAVSSGIDSRTILDLVGAEKLLGKGDMLFYPAGMSKPQRMQGAFITDKEVERIVQFVKRDGVLQHDQEMIEKITTFAKTEGSGEDVDELFDKAVDLVVSKEKASASMLQRQFRIGYNRAARLIDELEQNGIVGPEDGSKPRKVLLSQMALEQMRNPAQDED